MTDVRARLKPTRKKSQKLCTGNEKRKKGGRLRLGDQGWLLIIIRAQNSTSGGGNHPE